MAVLKPLFTSQFGRAHGADRQAYTAEGSIVDIRSWIVVLHALVGDFDDLGSFSEAIQALGRLSDPG